MTVTIRRLISVGNALLILLSISSCQSGAVQTSENGQTYKTIQTDVSTIGSISGIVKSEDFTITANEEGVPVIMGTLSSGVTINARLYCEQDLDSPGTGSIDIAKSRIFLPRDIDLFSQSTWTVVSDVTGTMATGDGKKYDTRTVEYINESGEKVEVGTTKNSFNFSAGPISLKTPDRIPWFLTDYAWQTSDFLFMTSEDAHILFDQAALDLGITLSSICKIDRVPYGVFDTYYRVLILNQMESVPDIEWTQADDAYSLQCSQEWNQLPIISEGIAHTFDGTNLEGDQYRILMSTQVNAVVTSKGIRDLEIYKIFQLEKQGEKQTLISMWDALQTVKDHIDNPTYPLEILYRISGLQNRNLTIDQIELCYVPIWQVTTGSEEYEMYDMVPCWTFRIVWYEDNGSMQTYTCIVNAITNEYILQTNYIQD